MLSIRSSIAADVPAISVRPTRAGRDPFRSYAALRNNGTGSVLLGAAVVAVLLAGWWQSDTDTIHPGDGLGYWLGISGAVAMLLLLIYPIAKRMRRPYLGPVAVWFRVHMMLGVIGPVLIVLHSNFELGALNSRVAFWSMLTVAISGLIGRYLYGKVHLGLYGRKVHANELISDIGAMLGAFSSGGEDGAALLAALEGFKTRAIDTRRGVAGRFLWALSSPLTAALNRARARKLMRRIVFRRASESNWSRSERRRHTVTFDRKLTAFFSAVVFASRLALFEGLLALWHVLHLPMFATLLVAGIVHVIAVHLY